MTEPREATAEDRAALLFHAWGYVCGHVQHGYPVTADTMNKALDSGAGWLGIQVPPQLRPTDLGQR